MARADDQSKQKIGTAEVTSSRRKGTAKSEAYVAPLWPCKINGCGKKFVREADLKRHQRTTKTHSMPSFTCQECDASFTRTDALRRHQKSRHHVVRALFRNTSAFIEEPATTSGEARAGSTCSGGSTRSRSTRSLSPRPSQEKEKERREKERKDRELPPLEIAGPSRYYRQHTATTTPYSPPPPIPQPSPPVRHQTHSSSLNAILASPISTPRLHPAKWSYSPTKHSSSHNGYAPSPPPLPPPPPPLPNNGPFVSHYRYPSDTGMAPALPAPMHSTPLSQQPHNPGHDHRRGQGTCPARVSHSNGSSSMREQSFTISPSPPLAPPIVSAGPIPLSASSFDSGSESEDEFDELLPSSPEPEPEGPEPVHESHCNRIPDIEACIDPATGITAEEVKAAMDAVLRSQQEQEQQQVDVESVVDSHGRGGLGSDAGIRVSSTADHDGSPFLSEISSSTLVNGRSHNVHARHGLPTMHRGPGRRIRRDCRSSSPSVDHHDDRNQSDGEDDVGGSSDMDIDERGNIKAYAAVGESAAAVRGGTRRFLRKVKVDGINELHEHDDDEYGPPSLDRSPSPLDHHIINEDGEHMLHSAELLTQVTHL